MRAMAEGDVGDLVRDHAGYFALIARLLEDSTVDVDESAGQSEGVDVSGVHHPKTILKLGPAGVGREPLPDLIDVRRDRRVIQDRHLLLSFLCGLLPYLDVLLRREQVESRLDLCLGVGDPRRQDQGGNQHDCGPRQNVVETVHGTSL